MGDKSRIEWTDATWNPVTGCDRVSPGCAHCYALDYAARLKAAGMKKYQKDGKPYTSGPGFGLTLHPEALNQPLLWKRPRRIFVNSMSDLFHEEIPLSFIDEVFFTMAHAQQHTFQVLTKRPYRMLEWAASHRHEYPHHEGWNDSFRERFRNVWLGVSVESQYWADRRIPLLVAMPAAVRFLSCEPLLGPIELGQVQGLPSKWGDHVNWVIVGGESGALHRPMLPEWALRLRDQSVSAGVPYFFKQWGGRTPKAAGRELDGRTWDEYPVAS